LSWTVIFVSLGTYISTVVFFYLLCSLANALQLKNLITAIFAAVAEEEMATVLLSLSISIPA
jgi:hypothetical protein